ncbi:MAG: outer membrane protein assembly factor BamD [Chitinispirillaceae bacterium]|nr:outer membrane protein assembly factor BamD [Chitinispirillaceae bacterium]
MGLVITACLLGSCAHGNKVAKKRYECGERFAKALKKYEAKKYGAAKVILDDVKVQCAGHPVMDSAGYVLGMSLARLKMYAEARLEFTRLTQDFPRSPFFEEAQFRVGWSVFKSSLSVERDQTDTREAQRLFRDFLESFPSSKYADSAQACLKSAVEKLAEKEFNSARFYQKIGEKEAAVVCYKVFISEYPASAYTAQARLNLGQMLVELGRTAEAREVLNALVEEETKGDAARKAQELLRRCRE